MAKQINLQQMPGETLQDLYTRLAKVADQRLVRLEKLSSQEGFQTATQWSYARAEADIAKWNQGQDLGKPRFNRGMPKNETQLRAKINDIRTFLQSPSSTKQGIIETYKKRAETFNRAEPNEDDKGGFGTNFTWEDLAKYYLSGRNKKLDAEFGSKTVLRAIGIIQRSKDPAAMRKAAWNNVLNKDKRVVLVKDDPILDETVNALLRKRSLSDILGT